ncbi:MAG: PASTA domain-containing protein [Myxococcales bacterium]|nr:PASTA domain-containing protein [Myxococcales bacterium]
MSRTPKLPTSRPFQALALVLSASALAGLVYVETVAARPDEDGDLAEDLEDELDEAELAELAEIPEAALPDAAAVAVPAALAEEPLAPAHEAAPVLAAVDPSVMAVATTTALEAAATTETEAGSLESPPAALVVVPDLSGMRLDRARRELAQLGLKMVAHDTWGERLQRSWYRDYKVRTQKIEAGTEVEPGTKIRVKARERFVATQGY